LGLLLSALAHFALSTFGYKWYVAKTEHHTDPKDGKEKQCSPKTKNEYYREMTQQAVHNQIQFKYVLNDVWFSAAENTNFVKTTLKKDFVMPPKANRKVTMSLSAKQNGQYQRVETLELEPYHKLLKQNASLEKSPTQKVTTQSNHFFAALCGYIKLELLKVATKINHFALKSKLYFQATQYP